MERVILHSDLNNFYASVECLYNPSLRGKPVAVSGDQEARHGIVLAKNYAAKACGVATGNPLWLARQKCPDIVFVEPHYDLYMKYSRIAREIYGEYTDRVESYGMDECWLDVTGSTQMFGDGKAIADTLRERIKFELGVTASVGVSYNKVFAKLGSDMKKPDATTVITSERFREVVWPLYVGDLLFVGRATAGKLRQCGINTIGDLARVNRVFMKSLLGKNGEMLWMFANGLDTSPVASIGAEPVIKSIGNAATAPRDLISEEDVRITLMVLCECVSARLRENGFICGTVQTGIRDNELRWCERQGKLEYPNRTANSLFEKSFELYKRNYTSGKPIRSLSVRACNLSTDENEQMSLFPDISATQRREVLESTADDIRGRFGHFAIQRGVMLCNKQLSALNPMEDHVNSSLFFM